MSFLSQPIDLGNDPVADGRQDDEPQSKKPCLNSPADCEGEQPHELDPESAPQLELTRTGSP